MFMPLRNRLRVARGVVWGLAGACLFSLPAAAATPVEKTLPGSTLVLVKVPDARAMRTAFEKSQMGQLWNDPAMKPVRESLLAKLEDTNNDLKNSIGMTVQDLIELPQGEVALAIVPSEDPKIPLGGLLVLEAGDKAPALLDALNKATKLAEEKGECKVMTEDFNGYTLKVIHSTKEEDKDDPPLVWTYKGSTYYVATAVDSLKDLLSNTAGRDNSLADSESFNQVKRKLGDDTQFLWFVDVNQIVRFGAKAAGAKAGNAQQIEAILQITGINGLKALGGSLEFNGPSYDSQTKIFVLAPAPTQGLLQLFSLPAVDLRPEPWVPASIASYETFSWDIDNAYGALNNFLNMLNPGLLQALQAQIAGPQGQQLDFQKDLCGPLGDRVTIISDYKKNSGGKPIDDNQRTLVAVALEDTQAFQNTINKILAITKPTFKKREFQGTTIYDIDTSDLAGGPGGNVSLKGPICLCVAKDTVFVATEPTLLEQVLRAGGPKLADSAEFQAVARELPTKTSTLTYARPDESARQLYDMFKTGQFQKAFEEAAKAKGQQVPDLGKLIDKDKLPDFSVFAKYLSQSGGYGLMTDEGFYSVNFNLRKNNP